MKRIFATVVSVLLLASMLAVSASADGFADIKINFDTMPEGLEDVEGVSLQSNKALKILLNGKTGNSFEDKSDPVEVVWGYKGWIHLSDEMIAEDSTVTFWVKRTGEVDGSTHALPLVLSDSASSPKMNEGENLGGAAIGTDNRDRKIRYYTNTADKVATTVEGSGAVIEDNTWVRMDYVVNFATKKTAVYADCVLVGEGDFSANAMGYKGLKTALWSSGNYDIIYYVDEIVVRKGLLTPSENDVCGRQDRDAIQSDSTVMIYEPFDTKSSNTMSNTGSYPWSVVEVDAFNQSTLKVEVPKGNDAFEAYMSFGKGTLAGNATVSFDVKSEYTVKKLPGLKIKLANADKKALGGIVIYNGGIAYDDGTHVWSATDAEGNEVKTDTGVWYSIDLLINYTNHSVTVYVNGTRLGTVAMEASDMEGFSGILLSKASNDGAKPQTFTFDNLSVVAGLYAPGVEAALADSDPLMTVDTQWTGEDKPEETQNGADAGNSDNGTETTEADDGDTEKKKGCKSSLTAGAAVLVIASAGMAVVSKKRKED